MKKNPFKPELDNYWEIRYEIFSKFDEGIQVDEEGLFSAKPETFSEEIACCMRGNLILDTFAGVGSSAIGLAKEGKRVISVDINKKRLEMARNNACVYCVENRIQFINEDAFTAIEKYNFDGIYIDPPWGGPGYKDIQDYLLERIKPNGNHILSAALKKTSMVAISLPLNINLNDLKKFNRDFEIKFHESRGIQRFVTVFFK